MRIDQNTHLTYCTNIHASEDWAGMWQSLRECTVPIRQALSPDQDFGIGLWLSNRASNELLASGQLPEFKQWLIDQGLYVFTFNAFPYGGFHRQVVKDKVHVPDWQTKERLNYTLRIIDILAELLPPGTEGGLSTSPLSYKLWLTDSRQREEAFQKATAHLLQVAEHLHRIYEETGQWIHLDIEPEPDGLIENTAEVIQYFEKYLLPEAQRYFAGKIPANDIAGIVCRHINVCYDICHFAVAFEEPATAIAELTSRGIRIGKVQISAALQAALPPAREDRTRYREAFAQFDEDTYLHQVIARSPDGRLTRFPDLQPALAHLEDGEFTEYRTHFHVPLFIDRYGLLESTQNDIKKTLDLFKSSIFTNHLEVETYTWEVLPPPLQLDLTRSIEREVRWVMNHLK